MVFDRTRLLTLPIEPEETYDYSFNNVVTESGNRNERRIARRTQFRATINYSEIIFKSKEEADAFILFYQESRGTADSFLAKSNVDFNTTGLPSVRQFENEFFTYTQGVAFWQGLTVGDGNQYSIYKKYAIASGDVNNPTDEVASYKRIYELDDSFTIQAYNNGVAISQTAPSTFDPVTAYLTITDTAVAHSVDTITFDVEYFHRMRFGDARGADKKLTIRKLSQAGAYSLSNLSLVEVILDNPSEIAVFNNDDFRETTLAQLQLPLEPDNTRILELPLLEKTLDSGRESRVVNSSSLFIDETVTPTSLYQDEAFYFRDFFVACKGRITGFQYEVDQGLRFSRFNQDNLTLTKRTAVDELNQRCTIYDIGEVLMSQIERKVVEIIGENTDLYGFVGGVLNTNDRNQASAIYSDIAFYVSQTAHIGENATGIAYPVSTSAGNSTRHLNYFTQTRQMAQSAGKNIVVLVWQSRSGAYYTDSTDSGQPTSTWNTDVANFRSVAASGDFYQLYVVTPTNVMAPDLQGFEPFLERAYTGQAPFDNPSDPQYIKDLVDSGITSYRPDSFFDRTTTDINPYLQDVFGGSIFVDYSGINPNIRLGTTRSQAGLTGADLNLSNQFIQNVRTTFEINLFNAIPGTGSLAPNSFGSTGRYLQAFNNLSTVNPKAVVFSAGADTTSYYTDETDLGQPTATWISDAIGFNAGVDNTEDLLYVAQLVPSGSEADPDYVGFGNQARFAIDGIAPYNNPVSPEYIADNSNIITSETIQPSTSALPVVAAFGGTVNIDPVVSGDNPIFVAAFCLNIETPEGTVGLTSFDSDLEIGGVTYRANFNIDALAGKSEINLSTDNGEICQVFDGFEAWTESQIAAGYLNSNRIQLRLFNPLDLPATFAEGIPIISGITGNVEIIDGSFKFEIRSVAELTNRPITHKTAPKCIYDFGDGRCGLDLVALGFQFDLATVTGVNGSFGETVTVDVTLSDRFPNGAVTMLSGNNVGLDYTIASVTGTDTMTLRGEFAGSFQVGDTLKVVAFCAKDQTACQFYNNFERFGNIPVGGNFVPGLTRIAVAPDN